MLAVTKVLLGDHLEPLGEDVAADRSTAKTISDVRRAQAPHWKCFNPDEPLVDWASIPYRTYNATIQESDDDSVNWAPHRTRRNATTQKKRKRKDSDEEYTPHQKVDNNSSNSTVRRTSKRLAASEQSSSTIARPHRTVLTTKRSSSSNSALTSTSSGSFDRLPTPKDPDTSDLHASTSFLGPRQKRYLRLRYVPHWLDDESDPDPSDSGSSDPDLSSKTTLRPRIFASAKIGFPPKEKKIVTDVAHPSTIKVGVHPSPHLGVILPFFVRFLWLLSSSPLRRRLRRPKAPAIRKARVRVTSLRSPSECYKSRGTRSASLPFLPFL